MKASTVPSLIKYIFGLIGLAMLVGAFLLVSSTRQFLAHSVSAKGVVIDLVSSRDSKGSVTYSPTVEFTTLDAQKITFQSGMGSNPPSYSVGESVDLLYDAAQPNQARINSFFSLWGAATIVGGLGFVFFLVGVGIFLSQRAKKNLNEYLTVNGKPVLADFKRVELNTSYSQSMERIHFN